MATFGFPATVRLGRRAIENFYQLGKIAILRPALLSSTAFQRKQSYSMATKERKVEGGSGEAAQAAGGVEKEMTENEKKLNLELEALNKDLAEYKDRSIELENKYKRALADGENLRVRLTKQIHDAKLFGIQEFCKDLLEVADILNKATESVPKDEISERNPHLKSLYEGLSMTEAQLQKVFTKHGLVSLNPLNEKFDPNQHEALFQQEVEGKAPGTVVVVSKVGYKLHERIVRPALVGVAKA
ncbi:grpE protein homolog 1, mitochondrial [Diprion similis]|uniref:grpE protein homolog 1, mitochondrial n=1 Tax=Diprion similis TaxID=362088 RepID=UPI001EF861E0|nr:grpE protein homolog 1, mitochondrial [Diprion similis]